MQPHDYLRQHKWLGINYPTRTLTPAWIRMRIRIWNVAQMFSTKVLGKTSSKDFNSFFYCSYFVIFIWLLSTF